MEVYKNIWIREDKFKGTDKKMVDDCLEFYSKFSLDENSVVMDLGANIGGFAKMCERAGVKNYIAVEPDSGNIQILNKNAENIENFTLVEGVVSVSEDPVLVFHQNGSPQGACSGTVSPSPRATAPMANKNKITFEVPNFNIDSVIEQYKPTHLKVDIEGEEINWLKQNKGVFPSHVQEISFEIHRKTGVAYFHDECLANVLEDFDIVSMVINKGFPNLPRTAVFPNLGIDIKGTLFGIDIFMRRK